MQKAINSARFVRELQAAGLAALPFSWGDDGAFQFPAKLVDGKEVPDLELLPQDKRDAVLAVYQAHDPHAPAVPRSVTRRQARQAMIADGISFAAVQQAIDDIADPVQRAMMQSEWEDSQEFHRDRPQLIALARALGLDDARLDALFVNAAQR